MMNYKSIRGSKVNTFDIHETQTNQIVMSGLTSEAAKAATRHMNMGGAFDGWTPAFFLKQIHRPAENNS